MNNLEKLVTYSTQDTGQINGRGNQKIPQRQSEDTTEVIRRYHRGHQKIPQRQSEDTTEAIRRYHRGNQKKPQRQSEDTTEVPLWYLLMASVVSSDCLCGIF
jgi:hypothetical protein